MSQVHSHHDRALGQVHAAPRDADAASPSVLMCGAAARVGAALGALVLLWAAVAWALADLS